MKRISNDFFTGINYWSSENAIKMWDDFREESIENDLKLLSEAKITHLRVFPLWSSFQPLTAEYSYGGAYEYRFKDSPLPDTEAGCAGVSETACENFEKFCALAEKYNMKLIVGLITGHMSFGVFAPLAFGGRSHITDATVMKWQLRFIRYFVKRFKNQSSIVGWDLGNEVTGLTASYNYTPDQFYVWCSTVAETIRSCDGTRPVISGMGDPGKNMIENGRGTLKELTEICDIHTFHPYHVFSTQSDPLCSMKPILDLSFKCRLSEDIGGKPTFVQEFGSIGYINCSYKSEAAFYRAAMLSALANGGHGLMWWCAFDQGKFDFPPYDWNNRGSDYGFFDCDSKPKPIVEENVRFAEIMKKLPEGGLPPHSTDGLIIVPRDDGDANEHTLRAAYILGKRSGLDLGFCYALDPIPESKLYIMPSLKQSMSIPKRRLDEVLNRVREGAVLYVSVSTAFFRAVPELFGVFFESREEGFSQKIMTFGGKEYPVNADVSFIVESVDAEVLGRDRDGTPMFFKNKYGKGCIYFLTAPLEKYLAAKKGAFFCEEQPKYTAIYREMAATAGVKRKAHSDNEFVCLTEHAAENGGYYLFAINYSNRKQTAEIEFSSQVDIETVFGKDISDGKVTLDPCDGALYFVKEVL